MNIRAWRKREEGDIVVLVALSMSVLMGFTAFAVDFGMLASDKQALQNAADAAALAAAIKAKSLEMIRNAIGTEVLP